MRGRLAKTQIGGKGLLALLRSMASGLPENARLVHLAYDTETDTVALTVESPALPETDMRRRLPLLELAPREGNGGEVILDKAPLTAYTFRHASAALDAIPTLNNEAAS